MDESTRIADALQDKYPECIVLFTYPGRDSMNIGIRREKEGEGESTMFQMCHMHGHYFNPFLVLADGGEQIADIATYWDSSSGSWETSAEMYAVEYANEDQAHDDEDGWRESEGGGYYRIGDEIDIGDICDEEDDDDDDDADAYEDEDDE